MAEPDAPQGQRTPDVQDVSEKAFSSEKREDIWALIIAAGILPTQRSLFPPGSITSSVRFCICSNDIRATWRRHVSAR